MKGEGDEENCERCTEMMERERKREKEIHMVQTVYDIITHPTVYVTLPR
ncbi:hypothetical protein A2U01_0070257, partial [Trifolium medium]|nr:hypothetical protein [Trifolium medium]